jgi:hypothetical protein
MMPSDSDPDPDRVRTRALPRWVTALGVIAVLLASLASCAGDGDILAGQAAQQAIEGLGRNLAPPGAHPRDADYLAAQLLGDDRRSSGWPDDDVHVGVLRWAGNSGDAAGARIEVRLIVDVDEPDGRAGILAHSAGSAIRCWRLTVFAPTRIDTLQMMSIACPTTADRTPHPAALPALPPDAVARLQAVLTTATADSLSALVRESFPDPAVNVDTLATNGKLFAAVGVPTEREQCVVGTRDASGTVQVSSGGLEDYQPSCSTALFFEPTLGDPGGDGN